VRRRVDALPQSLLELEKMPGPDFEKYIADAPRAFGRIVAKYHNGPILHTTAARVKVPNPQLDSDGNELVIDDTDYLEMGGNFARDVSWNVLSTGNKLVNTHQIPASL
jgi:hypothetical protein